MNKVLGIRVTDNLYSKLKEVSTARGEDVSDFIRRSILKELASLNYLSKDQQKALGLTIQQETTEQIPSLMKPHE